MRTSPILAAFLIATASLVSGCVDGDASAEPKSQATFDDETIGISGFITDEELVPLEGVTVSNSVNDMVVQTDAAGRFVLAPLEPGDYVLTAEKTGYATGTKTVTVASEAIHGLTLALVAVASNVPYHTTFTRATFIICWSQNIVGGVPCTKLVDYVVDNKDVPAAPKWIYDEVIPAIGTRVRSLHLLKQKGGRKSVLLFAEEAALVAEKGVLSGVKVYRVDYPRGLLLNESNCPHCHKQIQEPVGKVARLVGAKAPKEAPTFTPRPPAGKGVNVIDIEGIGPVFADKLSREGITTIAELRQADAAALAPKIEAPESSVRQWQSMGELMGVKGIGPQYAELLVRSGIESVAALRKTNPKALLAAIEETNEGRKVAIQGNPVAAKLCKAWIDAAKKHRK